MSIKNLEEEVYNILYKDKIMRMGRMDDCKPWSFNTEAEAEVFVFEYRSTILEQGVSSKRWDFYVFKTNTNLGVVQ